MRRRTLVPVFTSFFALGAVVPFVHAQALVISSQAVSGSPQIGFDSGLKSNGRIDAAYAAKDGGPANPTSFPFTWSNLPKGTKYLALVLDDPDARLVMAAYGIKGTAFLHWTAADIDASLGALPANASADNPSFVQGKNGRGEIGYTGPQPPSNVPKDAKKPLIHVYRLTVYALSAPTGLQNGYGLDELMAAVKGKVLGQTQFKFSYSNG